MQDVIVSFPYMAKIATYTYVSNTTYSIHKSKHTYPTDPLLNVPLLRFVPAVMMSNHIVV